MNTKSLYRYHNYTTQSPSPSSLWLLRREFNHIINPQNCYRRLCGEPDTLNLGYGGFQDAGLQVVTDCPLQKVQTVIFQFLELFLVFILGVIMYSFELRDQLVGIESGVEG